MNFQTHLNIFSSPNSQMLIVSAQIEKIFLVNHKNAASHDGRCERLNFMVDINWKSPQLLILEIPIKNPATPQIPPIIFIITQLSVFNVINNWHSHDIFIIDERLKERRKPIVSHFTVRLHHKNEIAFGCLCANRSRSRKAISLCETQNVESYAGKVFGNVAGKFAAIKTFLRIIVNQNYFLDELVGRSIVETVKSSFKNALCLVVKDYDDADTREIRRVKFFVASEKN